jgi:hypothetical protein
MKLKNAAQATAVIGRSTRVATTVAMEFALSCRPFRKSNNNATATNEAVVQAPSWMDDMLTSDLLDDDAVDHVHHIFAAIDYGLDQVVDLFHGQLRAGRDVAGEQLA